MSARFTWQMIIPLIAALAVGTAVFWYGVFVGNDFFIAAWSISNGGTITILLYNVLWIVFVDSKHRWPQLGAFDRFARFITFGR